eukprot:gene8316-9202_t
MDRIVGGEYRWVVADYFSLRSAQGNRLNHEQRLRLKKDGRPCPLLKYKGRTSSSVYDGFSWICGGVNDNGKSTYFFWPCLVMGDIAKLLGNTDVACGLDEARQRRVAHHNHNSSRYSKMLHHHIDATVFLAAQGLAFRGYDESSSSSNRGNFLELMEFLGGYSYDLRSFLDKERITYTSPEPQNDLIDCIAEEVHQEIQRRVDHSRFVGIMMDDMSDCANVEQSAISVRLVYEGEVEEHLLGLVDSSKDQSADGLSKILLETLKTLR